MEKMGGGNTHTNTHTHARVRTCAHATRTKDGCMRCMQLSDESNRKTTHCNCRNFLLDHTGAMSMWLGGATRDMLRGETGWRQQEPQTHVPAEPKPGDRKGRVRVRAVRQGRGGGNERARALQSPSGGEAGTCQGVRLCVFLVQHGVTCGSGGSCTAGCLFGACHLLLG